MNQNFEDINKVPFPSAADYDLNTEAGIILYLVHMNLEPMGGLINFSCQAEKSYRQLLDETAKKANEYNNIQEYTLCLEQLMILNGRITPLANDALLVMMMSILEESFNTWYRTVEIREREKENNIPSLKNYVPNKKKKEYGLNKAISYLKEYAGIDYDTIKNMYEEIMGFVDRVMR